MAKARTSLRKARQPTAETLRQLPACSRLPRLGLVPKPANALSLMIIRLLPLPGKRGKPRATAKESPLDPLEQKVTSLCRIPKQKERLRVLLWLCQSLLQLSPASPAATMQKGKSLATISISVRLCPALAALEGDS